MGGWVEKWRDGGERLWGGCPVAQPAASRKMLKVIKMISARNRT